MRCAVAIIVSLAVAFGAAGLVGWRDGGSGAASQIRAVAPPHRAQSRQYWRYLPVLR
ncbi:MAG: hypothetical protein V4512_06995 [Pseudomonadota bacterium]|uniref:hypothetical protein n=1 Tax=Sphingobium sp. KCTC 72723 TaxID=2733867 RepID=UPI00165D5FA6|nr:hypothetical protein [Sphingobium sp. KCTC 72723]